MSAIISAPFWKKGTASIHSHPGCEQSVPPAEMQCLAVVPSLHFTSVFGAISSNLSKSFCILALSLKRPCHPSLITLVCMHNNPTSSSLPMSSMQTQDGANIGECAAQPAVQTGNHWEQQLPRDVPSCSVHGLGPQLFHHVVFKQGALKQRGRGLWPQAYSYDAAPLRHMAEKVGRWVIFLSQEYLSSSLSSRMGKVTDQSCSDSSEIPYHKPFSPLGYLELHEQPALSLPVPNSP